MPKCGLVFATVPDSLAYSSTPAFYGQEFLRCHSDRSKRDQAQLGMAEISPAVAMRRCAKRGSTIWLGTFDGPGDRRRRDCVRRSGR